MFFGEAKENFQRELNQYLHDSSLFGGPLTPEGKKRKNEIVIKGRKFLNSISELHELNPRSDHKEILNCATELLKIPSVNNYSSLCDSVNSMKRTWDDSNYSAARLHIFTSSLEFTITSGLTVFGVVATAKAINTMLLATTVLAMGPWGALALGVGITLLGAVATTLAAFEIYKNCRLYKDYQLAEITEFVDFIKPEFPQHVSSVELSSSGDSNDNLPSGLAVTP